MKDPTPRLHAFSILSTGDLQINFEIGNLMNISQQTTRMFAVDCATEIGNYLSDHGNWDEPILPQQPGCDPVRFEPEEFLYLSNTWICDSTMGNHLNTI